MSILINQNTRLIVQGAAGIEGGFHMQKMIEYGTKVVAGIDPGFKVNEIHGVPAYKTVSEAVICPEVNASIIFVPAPFCFDAVMEAIGNNIKKIFIITEGVPVNDMIRLRQISKGKGITIIGPNCPGLISPGKSKAGILPGHIFREGNIGVISRSGTLTYEIVQALSTNGLGQSTCVGIGGDPVQGSSFIDMLKLFNEDDETKAVVMIGEIGGSEEEKAAAYIKDYYKKPVVAFIAGKSAPPGKTMGHAGAIISGGRGTAADKIAELEKCGVKVAALPGDIPELIKESIRE